MQFIINIAKQSEEHEEALMTIAQQIEQMGAQKGMQQSCQEGLLKDKLEDKKRGINENRQADA